MNFSNVWKLAMDKPTSFDTLIQSYMDTSNSIWDKIDHLNAMLDYFDYIDGAI